MQERIDLSSCVIAAQPDEAEVLTQAVEDLAGFFSEGVGQDVPIRWAEPNLVTTTSGACFIFVGAAARRAMGASWADGQLQGDAYILRYERRQGASVILAAGATPRGSAYALVELMRRAEFVDGRAFVRGPLDLVERPSWPLRGLHLNGWSINFPYSFRRWNQAQWRQYIDLLFYHKVNLLYIWPFMEILPLPLSPQDREALQEVRQIVEYAQHRRGMEVWVMQSANRIAEDRVGCDDPRNRHYWVPQSQVDLDPGSEEHFRRLMESREQLYRIVNNADAYVTIDCDPGGLPGSPVSDFVKVFEGSRTLLDRHAVDPAKAKLVYWMWYSWHSVHHCKLEVIEETVAMLKQRLTGPWGLICGRAELLPICRRQGVVDRTVYLPYAVVEGEPSVPFTRIWFDGIAGALGAAVDDRDLAGVMGNVQCPLLQTPNVLHFLNCAWDDRCRNRSRAEAIGELARLLFPQEEGLLSGCLEALVGEESAAIGKAIDDLDDTLRGAGLGPPGLFGRMVFPYPNVLAEDLLHQLRLQQGERWLAEISAGTSAARLSDLVESFLELNLQWEQKHGMQRVADTNSFLTHLFFTYNEPGNIVKAIQAVIGLEPQAVGSLLDPIEARLLLRHGRRQVLNSFVGPIRRACAEERGIVLNQGSQ